MIRYSIKATKRKPQQDEDIFNINEHDLWHELQVQSKYFHRYASRAAFLRKVVAKKKARKDLIVAELETKIRNDPEAYGIKSATVASVKHAMMLQQRYQRINTKLIEAEYKLDIVEVMVKGMEHRKKSLEKMCELLVMDYHSIPKLPRGSTTDELRQRRNK